MEGTRKLKGTACYVRSRGVSERGSRVYCYPCGPGASFLGKNLERRQHPTHEIALVFILGINFPEHRLLKHSLESFYGIGTQHSTRILSKFSIFQRATVGSVHPKTIIAITAELSNMTIETDLRKKVRENIARLKDMGSYRGRRHAMGLPVRGQRTRSQILTARKLNRLERFG
ncbi:hypothetical protein HYFRA_00012499 [Hymenoscyphus fraxineus]|uniref:Ribosomal protein S13 n=1 Tax=Hymenoscyphus fraxineus TaxID=746836 RepID=A0A9N9PKE8_9HELO|nr:hypothetical protein HYFRA_00012499 [Hymenoscyphus fraxineus]